MNWYPWLNPPYREIIARHQAERAHHALLLHALPGMGDEALAWGISRWLICQQRDGLKSCGLCHSCNLMRAGTHPDWHLLTAEKGKATLGVDAVRSLSEKLWQHARQGGAKVVWLPDAGQLTEAAASALLKILEEPPARTWFMLASAQPERLLATLRSRCLRWYLAPPPQVESLRWLQKNSEADLNARNAALRLSGGAPAAALSLLEPGIWQQRQQVCQALSAALSGDIFVLLPVLNQDNAVQRIDWLCQLLMDALKLLQGGGASLSNCDQQVLVLQIASRSTVALLDHSLRQWITCRDRLLHVNAVNRELLLTERLLSGEQAWPAVAGRSIS